jgi:hypothetical protein
MEGEFKLSRVMKGEYHGLRCLGALGPNVYEQGKKAAIHESIQFVRVLPNTFEITRS